MLVLGASRGTQLCQHVHRLRSINLHRFVARGLAAQNLDLAARAIEGFRQQADHRLICRRVHGRRGDLDAQFGAEWLADFVVRRAGRDFQREADAVRLDGQKWGQRMGLTVSVHFAAVWLYWAPQ